VIFLLSSAATAAAAAARDDSFISRGFPGDNRMNLLIRRNLNFDLIY
jgi:hypothetical protein